ncbi:acyl-CoA N-acyltransferase [Phycomyces nitens]|nr:acyl-CoA N-acyltransferase [Phycomyces nitens]
MSNETLTMAMRSRPAFDYTPELCFYCNKSQGFDARIEPLTLKCVDCHRNAHGECSGLNVDSIKVAQSYDWQCNDCKSCMVCLCKHDEEEILICASCDRGCHTFCCDPQVANIPEHDWNCSICSSMPSPSSIGALHSQPSSPVAHTFTSKKRRRLSDSQDYTPTKLTPDLPIFSISTPQTSPSPPPMLTRKRGRPPLKSLETQPRPIETHIVRSSRIAAKKATREAQRSAKETQTQADKDSLTSAENTSAKLPVRLRLTVKEHTKADGQLQRSRPKKEQPGRPRSKIAVDAENSFYETFGHKLTKAEADTKRGTPTELDYKRFEMAKQIAKEKADADRSIVQSSPVPSDGAQKQSWMPALQVPKITKIQFGDYFIDTWYVAPYPEEYSSHPVLYICEFCMKYMKSSYVAGRHKMKCPIKHPPGDEIYRDGKISIFEVDGRKNKIYCQNLCLLAKMFLDHKTLYYDVEPFLFYIMTEVDQTGCHFVGYFSKEKHSAMDYNVSCILTMPIHQRKGYGQYLIDFRAQDWIPERPLSDLGLLSYRSYWKTALYYELRDQKEPISIQELMNRTSMTADDIVSTLQLNHMLRHDSGHYLIEINKATIEDHLCRIEKKQLPKVDPTKLTWAPFLLTRDRLATLPGPQLTDKGGDEDKDVDVLGDTASNNDV